LFCCLKKRATIDLGVSVLADKLWLFCSAVLALNLNRACWNNLCVCVSKMDTLMLLRPTLYLLIIRLERRFNNIV